MSQPRREIEYQISEARQLLEDNDVTVFESSSIPEDSISLSMRLPELVNKGLSLGREDFYVVERRTQESEIDLGGVFFLYNDRPHISFMQSEESMEQSRGEDEEEKMNLHNEDSEERKRKEEVKKELLEEYEEYLDESTKYDLRNRLDRMRLGRLLDIKEEVEEEHRSDPEEEERLAKLISEDDRFSTRFNETKTELLLGKMDIEYNPEDIRIGEVHDKAKAFLDINRHETSDDDKENTGLSKFTEDSQ